MNWVVRFSNKECPDRVRFKDVNSYGSLAIDGCDNPAGPMFCAPDTCPLLKEINRVKRGG